ncbi:adenosine deaminase [bacterium]|nr:MAG: adenosine deaminase [bacterium]
MKIPESVRKMPKVELHQHLDGSIPPAVTWRIMKRYGLNPVQSLTEMKKLLQLQPDEEGSLLAYLDKFHFPMWITQFYENIQQVSEAVAVEAARNGVHTFELRYAPVIHVYAGLTIRQAIRSVMAGLNAACEKYPRMKAGLVVIAMRQHGPHVAKIIAKAAISEAEYLHNRIGVVGFDIAGPEHDNPPRLFASAYEVARRGGLGLTAHAGEDADPSYIWQAIEELGCTRIGHGCSAVRDRELMKRLSRDQILVECAPTSNYQTGAVKPGERHPIYEFIEQGIPVSVCTDNTTVSRTSHAQESAIVAAEIGMPALREIHRQSAKHTFIGATESWKKSVKGAHPAKATRG